MLGTANSTGSGLEMLGVPDLEPSLQCSACNAVVRELQENMAKVDEHEMLQTGHRIDKQRSKVNYKRSELFATEVMEKACSDIHTKYKLAQQRYGAHLKIFCTEEREMDRKLCTVPDYYSPEDQEVRYVGTGIRLLNKCKVLVGNHEEMLAKAINDGQGEEEMVNWLCKEDCEPETLEPYIEKERAARREWRRRKGKWRAAEPNPDDYPDDDMEELEAPEAPKGGSKSSPLTVTPESEMSEEERRELQELLAKKQQSDPEKERLMKNLMGHGDDQEAKASEPTKKTVFHERPKGLTFEEWRKQQQEQGEDEDEELRRRTEEYERLQAERKKRKRMKRRQQDDEL